MLRPSRLPLRHSSGPSTSTWRSSSAPRRPSPGDEDHPEPYRYVAPWDRDTLPLTELSYADLLGTSDRRVAALDFFKARRDALLG